MSIFSKLFKLFLTVVLMPLIPMALLLAYYQSRQQDTLLETHYNLAEIVASSMDHYVQDLSWRLAYSPRVHDLSARNPDAQAILQDVLAANPDLVFAAVLDHSGRERLRSARSPAQKEGEKIDLSSDQTLPSMSADKRLHLTPLETASGAPVAEFVYPLEKGGFLYGVVSFTQPLERVQQMRIGRTGQIYLSLPDGTLYAGPYQSAPQADAAQLQKHFVLGKRLLKGLAARGGSMVGAYAPSDALGVYVTVLQLKEEAFRSLYFSNVVIMLFMLAIATLAYFGARIFAQSLGEPIAALAEGAHAVSKGDLDSRVSADVGWGEFKELIDSFNKMTRDLKDYQALQLKNQVSEMKEQVFGSIAHDLRAPLLGLQGYIYILSNGNPSQAQRTEYLRRMKEAAENLSSLLEDALSVSRIEAGMTLPQLARVELDGLARNVLDTLSPAAAEKNLKLELDLQAQTAWADPKLLRRILVNLVSNAVKFTPQGAVTLTAREDEKNTFLCVTDTGRGMDEKQQEEIFEKYRQLDDDAQGYGLGLFISRQLARAHGGELSVSSRKGAGSTFTLRLPREER